MDSKMELKKLPDIISDIRMVLGAPADYPIKTIGIRAGEKLIEELYTEQEKARMTEYDSHYIIKPLNFD